MLFTLLKKFESKSYVTCHGLVKYQPTYGIQQNMTPFDPIWPTFANIKKIWYRVSSKHTFLESSHHSESNETQQLYILMSSSGVMAKLVPGDVIITLGPIKLLCSSFRQVTSGFHVQGVLLIYNPQSNSLDPSVDAQPTPSARVIGMTGNDDDTLKLITSKADIRMQCWVFYT